MCACRGFQSSTTAELMMKRMNRQKKLQSNVIKRQKMNGNHLPSCVHNTLDVYTSTIQFLHTLHGLDPGHRLALFHKQKMQAEDDDTTSIHPMGFKQRAVQQQHISAQPIPDPQGQREQSHYQ